MSEPQHDAASLRDHDPQQRESPPTDGWSTAPGAYAYQGQGYQDQQYQDQPQPSQAIQASEARPSWDQQTSSSGSTTRTVALLALVAGIVALVLAIVPVLGTLAALAALGLGIVALVGVRRGRHEGGGLAIGGVITSALAVLLSVGLLFWSLPRISEALSGEPTADEPSATAPPSPSASPKAPEPSVEAPPNDAASEKAPPAAPAPPPDASALPPQLMAVGTKVTLGDWEVSVEEVRQDSNAEVVGGRGRNPAPEGKYVGAVVKVGYTGPDIKTVGVEVNWQYLGTDALAYREAFVYLPGAEDLPRELRKGDTLTAPVFFDVATDAVAGGVLQVQVTNDVSPYQARWAVPAE